MSRCLTLPILLIAILLTSFPSSTSARPPLPKIGGNITTQIGMSCELEADCPVRQFCYLDDEGVGSCDCYQFYGMSGPDCLTTNPIAPIFPIISLVYCLYQMANWLKTFKELNDVKVKAFSATSAAGHVTITCVVANVFEVVMHFCYIIVAAGLNPTYEMNDLIRPLSFGLCVVIKLTGVFELPIMWMDIVIKSPGMNSPENKARFKKIATGLRVTAMIVGFAIIFFMASGNAQGAAFFFMFILLCSIAMYWKASKMLATMICKNFHELGYKPDESKFANSAEKSGHAAALNILLVSGAFSKAALIFFFSLAALGVTVKSKTGIVPLVAACSFLGSMSWIQATFRNYVRLGARKKLAAAGYAVKGTVSSKVSSSSASSGADTSSSADSRDKP